MSFPTTGLLMASLFIQMESGITATTFILAWIENSLSPCTDYGHVSTSLDRQDNVPDSLDTLNKVHADYRTGMLVGQCIPDWTFQNGQNACIVCHVLPDNLKNAKRMLT